jgi:serine/threonine-protein kinase
VLIRATDWSKEAMPTKIGQFEIISEISKSPVSSVYKANDPESGQTIALKTIELSAFGEHAAALEQALVQEVESVKVLSSPNLCAVVSASIIDGQFCAAMEYVQGNSIATMLARNEGFSIWDLLDIGRQLGTGLDHAASHQIAHYSLEPSKIMCGWDGTVKILSYGVSRLGQFVQHADGDASSILHYMSPEQIRGEGVDARSNLFSLGAIFYEMVTERKAFDANEVDSLRRSILESTPVPPIQVNAKVHPLLSDLIVKALAKDPAHRYQSGKALLEDLENCKETRPTAKKVAPKMPVGAASGNPAAQSKFIAAPAAKPQSTATSHSGLPASPSHSRPTVPANTEVPPAATHKPKTSAAAAGIGASATRLPAQAPHAAGRSVNSPAEEEQPVAYMSSAVSDKPEIETFEPATNANGPKIAVDPLMAGGAPGATGGGTSFSEISELPPLKEVYVAPEPPPAELPAPKPVKAAATMYRGTQKTIEKPKIQPREVAGKAIKEIRGVPPKLMIYALAGAAVLIVAIAIGVTLYIHGQNDDDSGARRSVPVAVQTPQPEATQPAPQPQAPVQPEAQPAEIPDSASTPVAEAAAPAKSHTAKKRITAPVVAAGQLTIDSTPQGAQVELDGNSDPSWVTPVALTNLQPGQHSVIVSKPGYASETRSVAVASGARAAAIVHLSQLTAMLVVKSDPPGANVYVDSHDIGAKTPAQVSVSKGQHLILVRKEGYLDETTNAQFVLGQTFSFSPILRTLGNVDNIKTVGKMSKFFGKKGQADQGTVAIHTQPKGAQIAINQHMLDKSAPVDIMLDPGNYVVDVTASGYAPIHKIITVEKGSKLVIDDVMVPQ